MSFAQSFTCNLKSLASVFDPARCIGYACPSKRSSSSRRFTRFQRRFIGIIITGAGPAMFGAASGLCVLYVGLFRITAIFALSVTDKSRHVSGGFLKLVG